MSNFSKSGFYYKVVDGKIVSGATKLPRGFGNISNFHTLPDSVVKDYGFLPEFIQNFDASEYHPNSESLVVKEDRVELVYDLEERPTQAEIEQAWIDLRVERNRRLAVTDYTHLTDAQISDDMKQAYAVYRQALRDLPQNTVDPLNPEWPVLPSQNEE